MQQCFGGFHRQCPFFLLASDSPLRILYCIVYQYLLGGASRLLNSLFALFSLLPHDDFRQAEAGRYPVDVMLNTVLWRTIGKFVFPSYTKREEVGWLLHRAFSLGNLVSGYECGRVFQGGVGPGSPSRNAANWLPSRFGLSVEMWRRYGWLRMVFPGARLFRAPIWCPSGGVAAREGQGALCRGEPGSAWSGGYAPDSAKVEVSSIVDEPGGC